MPSSSNHLPIFFFHGGGFVAGNLDTEDTPLRAVANRCGCIVVSVAYRLAPENLYPAAPNDAFAATKWVAQHAIELGGEQTSEESISTKPARPTKILREVKHESQCVFIV